MKISKIEFKLMRYFLGLRLKMAYRLLRPLGLMRIAVLVFLVSGLVISLVQISATDSGLWYLVTIFAFFIGSIQLSRRDRDILRVMRMKSRFVFASEYLLLAVPLVILLLFDAIFIPTITILLLCWIIARFPFMIEIPHHLLQKKTLFKKYQLPFEWISGLRNRGFTLLFLLILGIVAACFHLITGWIIAVGLTGLIASFYKYCESKDFIRVASNKSFSFITGKVIQGVGYYGLTGGILWLVLIIMHPLHWEYTGLVLMANVLLLVMIIAGKYAFYNEHKNIELVLSLLFGAGVLCLIIPFLVPVVLLLIGWLLQRGNKRLKEEVYGIH